MLRGLSIISLGLGCASDPRQAKPAAEEVATDSAWVDPAADDDWSHLIDEAEGSEPVSVDEVEAELNAALALGIPHMGEIFSRYYALMEQGDETCPGSAMVGGFEVFGSCTADTGVVFSGVSSLDETDGRVYEGDVWVSGEYWVRTSPADYIITRTDGTALEAGGFIQFRREPGGDGTDRWSVSVEGSWRDTSAEGWLGEGISSGLIVQGSERDGEGTMELEGSYTVGTASLVFERLSVGERDCPDGFEKGSLAFRSSGGTLVTVDFSSCSTCGPATLDDGSSLGELCVDPAPVLESLEPSGWIP